jgi:hypothetical protein
VFATLAHNYFFNYFISVALSSINTGSGVFSCIRESKRKVFTFIFLALRRVLYESNYLLQFTQAPPVTTVRGAALKVNLTCGPLERE